MSQFWANWAKPILIVVIAMVLFSLIAKKFNKCNCQTTDAGADPNAMLANPDSNSVVIK